ncbi:fimbrial chaperone [Edwardsiella tarda]|uniref:fimbrial chaperone n=1 Tax=Edwardsiella tarda TaxID=636 RepID=UPI00098FDB25|nr:fimbrial chaperone [Edwardsiella tarda]
MNNLIKVIIIFLFNILLTNQSMAAFILSNTRVIYDGGKKNASFEIVNNSNQVYGGQVWIDNTEQHDGVYMIPSPPFFKINAKQRQIVRIMKMDLPLPKDRESLFWLNVQEIPPKPEEKDSDGSLLAIAMNTRVKLIYRPKSIITERSDAEKKLTLEQRHNATWLKNPTPYYMAVVGIKNNGISIKLSDKVMQSITVLAPFSSLSLDKRISNKATLEIVNDWGGVKAYEIK